MSNESGRDDAWHEVAAGCFVRRYESFDVSCGVVAGDAGLLVIDTRASLAQGRALAEAVRELSSLPIRAVANTHVHFDHTFGNGAFAGVPIVAHEAVSVAWEADAERIHARYADAADDPLREEVLATEAVAPTETFSSVWAVDLGDRLVELVHPGRGHTDGDIVIRVPDADVVYAGDLVESSAPPMYGTDSFPLDWPDTLDMVIGLLTSDSVVVPGHGPSVDRDFVQQQRGEVVDIAEQIRVLATTGVSVDDALARGTWPYPSDHLANAVRRGYASLP
ncbi:MAG TPA: MBL fold metallo-hydrolase [Nocardioidaceae bacterium]|nr:MBL fold metallo-hydrolase [Nocardioidaceae bacterium]